MQQWWPCPGSHSSHPPDHGGTPAGVPAGMLPQWDVLHGRNTWWASKAAPKERRAGSSLIKLTIPSGRRMSGCIPHPGKIPGWCRGKTHCCIDPTLEKGPARAWLDSWEQCARVVVAMQHPSPLLVMPSTFPSLFHVFKPVVS